MKIYVEGWNNIIKCLNCDYELVTTYTSLIKLDQTKYKLMILANEASLELVEAFSKTFKYNYIEYKKTYKR